MFLLDAIGGALLYLGLAGAALGLISLLFPLRFLGIRTRKKALQLFLLGGLSFMAGVFVPVRETHVAGVRSRLDEFAPAYQFREFHSTVVRASKQRVYAAIHEVRPGEIRYFRALLRIRGLNLPRADRPVLESFTAGWFLPLADDPGSEVVFGAGGVVVGGRRRPLRADQFGHTHRAPSGQIVMNFAIEEVDGGHCRLTTETRVYALGGNTLRGFSAYWRLIRPGSALIRREWLRAIRERAEAADQPFTPAPTS